MSDLIVVGSPEVGDGEFRNEMRFGEMDTVTLLSFWSQCTGNGRRSFSGASKYPTSVRQSAPQSTPLQCRACLAYPGRPQAPHGVDK